MHCNQKPIGKERNVTWACVESKWAKGHESGTKEGPLNPTHQLMVFSKLVFPSLCGALHHSYCLHLYPTLTQDSQLVLTIMLDSDLSSSHLCKTAFCHYSGSTPCQLSLAFCHCLLYSPALQSLVSRMLPAILLQIKRGDPWTLKFQYSRILSQDSLLLF